jgi:1-acyl-sn-glycerol-3-phosphate acyltransferase
MMLVLFVVTVPFDKGRYVVGRWFRIAAMMVAKTNPFWLFRTSGIRVDQPRRPYVVVANHESFADILLISHLPWEMKWMSKAEFFRIPVVGWEMWLAGDIPLRRGSPGSPFYPWRWPELGRRFPSTTGGSVAPWPRSRFFRQSRPAISRSRMRPS